VTLLTQGALTLTSATFGDPSAKKLKLPIDWPNLSSLSFGSRLNGTKAHTSTPRRASMACSIPSLVPTQMIERRAMFAAENPG
jgi:hypothetical protein